MSNYPDTRGFTGFREAYWILSDIEFPPDEERPLGNHVTELNFEELGIVLRSLKPRSLNIGEENAPQELIDLAEKPLQSETLFREAWSEFDRNRCVRAVEEIDKFYDAYNHWKQFVEQNENRWGEILTACNEAFQGRLEIQT